MGTRTAKVLEPCVDCEFLEVVFTEWNPKGHCKKEGCSCEMTNCILQVALREYCEKHTVDHPIS